MEINNLCMGCMNEMTQTFGFCPYCGYKVGTVNSSRGLQPQTILNGKFLIGKIIGEGGFGITYIAYDLILNNRVAIKEYFPSELVTRDTSKGVQTSLTILTSAKEEQYKAGIERFVQEARNLAKFNNLDGIVSVKEFFYENNTAYMVMEYIEGITLSQYLESHGNKLPYNQVIKMMTPVMDSLEKIHAGSIVHRDISPDNIMVSDNGAVKLIDFGAARIVDNTDQKSLTVILKHGYAPEEQYQSHGNQGPWTDIYALSATMYRMITGIVPQESTDRVLSGDKVVPVNKLVPEVPKRISDAIMHGLAVKASNRPQTISDFRSEMEKGHKNFLPIIIAGIAAMVLITGIAGLVTIFSLVKKTPKIENSEPEHTVAETETKKSEEPGFEEESEIPKVKVLTEEEKQALWREYQDKITNTIGVSLYVREGFEDMVNEYYGGVPNTEKELYGCFDDYDGDGDYELFFLIYGDCGATFDSRSQRNYLFFADEDGVWFEEEKVNSNSQSIINFQDEVKNFNDGVGFVFLVPSELGTAQLGKQKFCYYYQQPVPYGKYVCYTVYNDGPKFYDVGMQNKEGIVIASKTSKVGYYTAMDETVYFDNKEIYYSPYYMDGNFGELASCPIKENQWTKIDGLIEQINIYAGYITENTYNLEMGRDGRRHVLFNELFDEYRINDAVVDSVFYNEAGYFVFNYKCGCTFIGVHPNSILGGGFSGPYTISMAERNDPEIPFEYTGKVENMNTDTIEGIDAYVILKYDGQTYSFVTCGNGKIEESITDNVLLTSKCPYVQ